MQHSKTNSRETEKYKILHSVPAWGPMGSGSRVEKSASCRVLSHFLSLLSSLPFLCLYLSDTYFTSTQKGRNPDILETCLFTPNSTESIDCCCLWLYKDSIVLALFLRHLISPCSFTLWLWGALRLLSRSSTSGCWRASHSFGSWTLSQDQLLV